MTQLNCSVQTCMHNSECKCDLDQIRVNGDRATTARETCCDSFRERTGNDGKNRMGTVADLLTDVECKAKGCMYNDHCQCKAGKISIEGSRADRAEKTECAAFECSCGR